VHSTTEIVKEFFTTADVPFMHALNRDVILHENEYKSYKD